ncbi:gtp-binding protein hflx [Holotrichia oblita]|uniref:Gtp-binding protein hflx n=1 Tax=Holotrichia oblita TaxID=644536 RepID=A0ACB9TMC2_HOLOL|nr:gtp-binding protein hflx [Holotrichia oblita]
MKLICTVSVGNRQLSTLAISNKQKHSKSTLALCKHPKKDTYCVILFSNNSKNGNKYEVKGNISNILTKFLSEGKATIQFKQPPHDFYIQAEVIPLRCFLQTLKGVLLGTTSEKDLMCSSLAITPVSLKNIPPKKLVIKKRSDYPSKGFPRTLEILHINGIDRCSIDIGILKLVKLRILDLSSNCIESLPIEFCNLPSLSELNLSHNMFGKCSPKQWTWINGMVARNLKQLNLCHNNLIFLPDSIIKLNNLITLNLDHNQLTLLPSGIGNLSNLKTFTVSCNSLEYLPGSVKKLKLQNVDLSHNNFNLPRPNAPHVVSVKSLKICSLKEYSAKAVLYYKLYYNQMLPSTLIHYLELAKYLFLVYLINKQKLSEVYKLINPILQILGAQPRWNEKYNNGHCPNDVTTKRRLRRQKDGQENEKTIFRLHAISKHAKLQVALAEISFLQSRLTKYDTDFIGSSAIDTRNRILQTREKKIKEEIKKLRAQRELLRHKRKKSNIPVIAVVGYTNVGKTSLIKTLTKDKTLLPKNQLFATLDVTLHAGLLLSTLKVLYVDTVGFLSDIPTGLIECFHATLEDAVLADVVLHVEDLSSGNFLHQRIHVLNTIKNLSLKMGVHDIQKKMISVGNKSDIHPESSEPILKVSAKTKEGIDTLKHMLEKKILKLTNRHVLTISLPVGGDEVRWLYKNATVVQVKEDKENIQNNILSIIISEAKLNQFKYNFIT